jgi:chromosome segregation ATPase
MSGVYEENDASAQQSEKGKRKSDVVQEKQVDTARMDKLEETLIARMDKLEETLKGHWECKVDPSHEKASMQDQIGKLNTQLSTALTSAADMETQLKAEKTRRETAETTIKTLKQAIHDKDTAYSQALARIEELVNKVQKLEETKQATEDKTKAQLEAAETKLKEEQEAHADTTATVGELVGQDLRMFDPTAPTDDSWIDSFDEYLASLR